jgi:hypothetical protein
LRLAEGLLSEGNTLADGTFCAGVADLQSRASVDHGRIHSKCEVRPGSRPQAARSLRRRKASLIERRVAGCSGAWHSDQALEPAKEPLRLSSFLRLALFAKSPLETA